MHVTLPTPAIMTIHNQNNGKYTTAVATNGIMKI